MVLYTNFERIKMQLKFISYFTNILFLLLIISLSSALYTSNTKVELIEQDYSKIRISLDSLITENQCLANDVSIVQRLNNADRYRFFSKIKKQLTHKLLTITAYTPSPDETDSTPFEAASGLPVHTGTVAVSKDLFDTGWTFGRIIYIIEMDEFFMINDLMHNKWTNKLDILKWDKKEAIEFGIRQFNVYLL